jgi:multidrug efflux pump subunit AcrA (membrane-fusion protein)
MKWKMPLGIILVIALSAGVFFYFKNQAPKNITMIVRPSEFVQQVSVAGKVVPIESLDLSFEQSGRVTNVATKIGDSVSAGQILASQDTSQLEARLVEIQANIDLQKAKLNQFLSGASAEDLTLAQTAITNAETSVLNAKDSLLNTKQSLVDTIKDAYTKGDDAVLNKADQFFSNPQTSNLKLNIISSDSNLKTEIELQRGIIGDMLVKWNASTDALTIDANLSASLLEAKQNLNTLKSFFEKLSIVVNNPNSCVFTYGNPCEAVSSTWKTDVSTARTTIITASGNITSAEGAYKTSISALKTAEGNLKTANDQYLIKKAPARSADVSVYQAQVNQAEASKQDVLAQLYKKQVRAPIAGVVTAVEAKVGKIVGANESIVSMISSGSLEIESYVPEKNLPFVKIGDSANVFLDAYGSDVLFATKVVSIDPSETIRDGVTTYRILLQFVAQDDRVKPGMTASVIVDTEKKSNVISVPQGIIELDKGNKVVKVMEGETITYRTVQTGSVSTLGTIEIISGLTDGDVVVIKESGK